MRNAINKDPLYDVDWINGRAVQVFYADGQLAREFGGSGSRPVTAPTGTRSRASRDVGDVEQNRRGTPPAVRRSHLRADCGALPVVEGWGLLGLFASWCPMAHPAAAPTAPWPAK
jgi:hypothetical protein